MGQGHRYFALDATRSRLTLHTTQQDTDRSLALTA